MKQTNRPELEVTGGMTNEQKGVKRQAAFEHLEFCNRSVRKSALKYPWDSILQYNPHSCFDLVRPSGATPLVFSNIGTDSQQVDLPRAPVSLCKKFFTKQPRIDWEVKLNAMRESAIVKWQRIVGEGPMFFEVSRYFFLSIRDGHETGTLFDCIKNVFANKSTSTLNSRVGPLLRYVFHCKTTSKEAFPLIEARIYEYMLYEESKVGGAPTYLRSFISSLAFCHYVLGLQGAKSIVESKRITGLATKMYLTKKKTESRFPFTVSELKFLEDMLFGKYNRSWADRHFVGCILFMVYARARFSDMMNVCELVIEAFELDGKRDGFAEAKVTRSKTSYNMDRRVRLLPMSATIRGVTDRLWADQWWEVIGKAGIQIETGKPLLPGRTQDGWHTLPLSAEAATNWLRSLLLLDKDFDKTRLQRLGTHSAKSTCLSWMSKWGTDPQVRRLMGYHVGDKCATMMIYGKDNTSAGLRELDAIIDAIRSENFRPDLPRACMFKRGLLAARDEADPGEDLVGRSGALSDDSSSMDSADEDQPDHKGLEAAEEVVVGRWDGGIDVGCIPVEASFFRHNISRIIHMQEDETGLKFVCGRDINGSYFELQSRPQNLVPVCKQCFTRYALKR